MPSVRSFTVLPALPESLSELDGLAKNLYWSWNPSFIELFKRIDPALWAACGHNPVKLLGNVAQPRLEALSQNESFRSELDRVSETLGSYLEGPTWFQKVCGNPADVIIAYFSAEFGLHECLPIYAGGLGILAGDHLKSASDLGIPLVGVGLMYQKGYFRQYLNIDGWQQENYVENDLFNMPAELVRKSSGRPLTIGVEYPGRTVQAQVWCISVGRLKLYLLDTNIPANSPGDRMITSSLYGGDRELRMRQEILLGIGGLKALAAMDIKPTVCHMNEGHAAFMALERIRQLRSTTNMTFEEAVEATRSGNVFTTHTIVKAGLDEFDVDLMDKYFGGYFPHLGINRRQFLALGRMLPDDDNEPFKMPVLAIKLSSYLNGVSKLHGQISREVWGSLWPGLPSREVPIISITNGIHLKTWLSDEMSGLYDRYLGPTWSSVRVRQGRLGPGGPDSGRGAVECPPAVQGPVDRLCPKAPDGPDAAPRHVPGRAAAGRGGARSRGADHRLRPAVRRLQAGRSAPARHRAADAPGQQPRPARADHLRRQGASQGQRGQGDHPPHHPQQLPRSKCAGASSSWRTTTSTSPASSCGASMSGSTTRAGRWKPAAPAA